MTQALKPHYDLLISGGGPVGLTLALGASQLGLEVLVVEKSVETHTPAPSFDGRMLALNKSSMQLFEQVELYPRLAPKLTPIQHVHVSQQGYLGVTTLHAEEQGVEALGYSVLGRDLGEALASAVQQHGRITLLRPAEISAFTQDDTQVSVHIGEQTVSTALLVGADGTASTVRQQLGWPLEAKAYGSYAILAQVETYLPHENWAYERFTVEGPVALLPHQTHHHKAVMVVPAEQKEDILALSDQAYLAAFTDKMGPRCGGFKAASPRLAYPLQEAYVPRVAEGRVAIMGNASHTQHPVAAQGLNLGLRDVADYLAYLKQPQALSMPTWLQGYEVKRQRDHQAVMGMTDSLIALFQLPQPLAGHLRGVGLMGLELLPRLKRRLARFGMEG